MGWEPLMSQTELKEEIVSIFRPLNPHKIILFGSLARGQGDEESDIDLIIVYHTPKAFLDRLRELYLAWNIPRAVDILAYTPEEFEHMMENSSFIRDAVEEGEVLCESA
jgi:uncharacterized protein